MLEIINKSDEARSALMLSMTPGEGNGAAAILALHNLAMTYKGLVDEIDAAAKGQDKTDKVNPLEVKYGKDEPGAKAALDFLRQDGGIFDLISEYCKDENGEDDAGKTFHLRNAMRLASEYLASECSFHTNILTPKAAKVSRKAEYKVDFNETRDLIAHIVGIGADKSFNPAKCEFLEQDKQGNWRSVVKGMRGARKSTDATGRYAKVYNLAWQIDGEEIDWDQISDLTRILWTGADRIGKTAKSLTDILDSKTTWNRPDFESKNLTINGHKVVVSRLTDDDDDEEEAETE